MTLTTRYRNPLLVLALLLVSLLFVGCDEYEVTVRDRATGRVVVVDTTSMVEEDFEDGEVEYTNAQGRERDFSTDLYEVSTRTLVQD